MILQDLGDELVIRRATAADTDELATFNAEIQADPGEGPDLGIEAWTRDLMEGHRPRVTPSDFTVVEDTRTGAIVSSLCLISQTWSYAGIEFPAGQIEIVSTHPDYRRRGLVRRQFEIVHGWSQRRRQLIQVISGIPWYYRQFGYELALDNTSGRSIYAADLPPLNAEEKDTASEPVRLRPARPADLAFIEGLDASARSRSLVACVRDAALWRHELGGRRERSTHHLALRIAETASGMRIGYVAHVPPRLRRFFVTALELAPGASWLTTIPSLLRALFSEANAELAAAGAPPAERVDLRLGTEHPVYRAVPELAARPIRGFAWYVRVPDVPAFLRRIAAVLESRLAASDAVGFTGELKLGFYRTGVQLHFSEGRLEGVEAWPRPERWEADVNFPDLTFLQILFGYRSFGEIEYAFPDCFARTEAGRALIDVLFPKRPSRVWEAT